MIKHTLYTNRGLHIHLTKKNKIISTIRKMNILLFIEVLSLIQLFIE